MRKLILLLMLTILIIPFIYAESDNLGTFKINDCINLKQTCSNCSYVNITSVVYPNSTQVIGEVRMTKLGTEYNYTFCLSSLIGKYTVNGKGDPDGVTEIFVYDFEVTSSGYELSNSQTWVIFFVIGIIFVAALLFFIFGIRVEHPATKIFCLSVTVILIVFLIGYIFNVSKTFLTEFTSLTNSFEPLFIIFIALLTAGGIGLILYLIYYAVNMFYKYRGLKLD
jgi:magnesium-transporting ATPase (P-type)